MGADISYPIHRYFLWGKQIELLLGVAERPAGPAGPPGRRRDLSRPRRCRHERRHHRPHDFRATTRTFDEVTVGDELPDARASP